MSFPEIHVLERFLDDYIEMRQPTWHSTGSMLLQRGSQLISSSAHVLSLLTSAVFSSEESKTQEEEKGTEENDEAAITHVCEALKSAFKKAKNLGDWEKAVFDLGEEARKSLKRSKTSLFCQTLHAMRTYILEHLRQEKEFKDHLANYRKIKLTLDDRILEDQLKNLVVDSLEGKRSAALYNLADLGEPAAILECSRVGLFKHLLYPKRSMTHQLKSTRVLTRSDVNIHMPWYYQENFYQRYHQQIILCIKTESFDDFKDRARKKGKLIVSNKDAHAASVALQAASKLQGNDGQPAPGSTLTPQQTRERSASEEKPKERTESFSASSPPSLTNEIKSEETPKPLQTNNSSMPVDDRNQESPTLTTSQTQKSGVVENNFFTASTGASASTRPGIPSSTTTPPETNLSPT